MVSQKCQYAVRAVYELAKHYGGGPVKIASIAQTQAIPQRFLEIILNQIRGAGIVDSRRGSEGGYMLVRPPEGLTVGEVMRVIEGPLGPVECVAGNASEDCPLHDNCVFMLMWQRARDAVSDVYDGTTFRDLLDSERAAAKTYVPCYSI